MVFQAASEKLPTEYGSKVTVQTTNTNILGARYHKSFIGPITANRLLKRFDDPELVYQADEKDVCAIEGITQRQIRSILENRSLESAYKIMEDCEKNNIFILPQNDLLYPKRAKEPEDSPVVLYYKGCLQNVEKTVGIVGARRCTQEAKFQAVKITEKYVIEDIAIISGMAKGIDSYAHTACLRAGGYTVAILGNGLDICYPSEHKKLMEHIAEKGLLISEYPPGTEPAQYRFPRRNRLISAWSDKLIVISPGKGSGAFITAEYEKKYGREVELFYL